MKEIFSPVSEPSLKLQFLKLGGSLITDKTRPHTPRLETIARLAGEIQAAYASRPDLRLIIGHGSGSYGHVPAKQHHTRQGVSSPEGWGGFLEVWFEAQALNRLVLDHLAAAGLPVIGFSPVASVTAEGYQVAAWDLTPLRSALGAGLIPVVYGDVIFDRIQGGTILSTEDLFGYLAIHLQPQRILLAGIEPGVWTDYPACTQLALEISPDGIGQISSGLAGSAATDVTGGMASKVAQSIELVRAIPGLQVLIFSGEQPGALLQALSGDPLGTVIRSEGQA